MYDWIIDYSCRIDPFVRTVLENYLHTYYSMHYLPDICVSSMVGLGNWLSGSLMTFAVSCNHFQSGCLISINCILMYVTSYKPNGKTTNLAVNQSFRYNFLVFFFHKIFLKRELFIQYHVDDYLLSSHRP